MKIMNSFLARMPVPVKLGVPVAAALLAAACGSSAAATPSAGSSGAGSSSAASPSASAMTATITTHAGSAGQFLTDSSGKTVYLFAADGMNKSNCSGACASAWPPVPAKGSLTASGGAMTSDLGSISRADGTKQVTYKGHPLYYFAGDSGAGQTHGQGVDGFGAKWYVLAPSGTQITGTETASAPSAPASSPASSPAGSSGGSSAGGGWS